MPEWRMAEVVSQGQTLGEILIEAEGARYRPGNLHNLERVRESRPVVVAFVIDENLGFVGETPEGGRMDNPVAIPPERIPACAGRLDVAPAPALRRIGGINRSLAPRFDRHAPH
jgi:hypothetical protein